MRSSALFFLSVAALAALVLASPGAYARGSGCGHRARRGDASVDVVGASSSTTSPSSRDLDLDKRRKHPWFCHDLDCPSYKLINETEDYETRRLRATRWATTDVEAYSIATAQAAGFTRLFDYISGKNAEERKIEMTAPVLTHVTAGAGPWCKSRYSVSFYVGEAGAEAPSPTDPDVYLRDASSATVFVASRGGFVVDDYTVASMAKNLRDALERDGVRTHSSHHDKGGFWTAGYDPPFRLSGRHTEVWMVSGEGEGDGGRESVVES